MCCRLVLLTVGAVLIQPAPVTLLEVTDNRVHKDGPTSGDDVSTIEEAVTDPIAPYSLANGTLESGPGAACRQSSDCASPLVCLASQSCGCPERAPVLVREQASFDCWMPSQSVQWLPRHTASFLASLLSLSFAILGIVGYRRLKKTRAKKLQLHGDCYRRRGSSGTPYERFLKSVESLPTKNEIMGTASNSYFSLRAAEIEDAIQSGYEIPQISRDTHYAVAMEDDMQRKSTSTAGYSKPHSTWSSSRSQIHRASTAIRHTLPRSKQLSPGPESLNKLTVNSRDPEDTASPTSLLKMEGGGKPSPRRRTKISTLSTSTLKQRRRTRRVSFDSCWDPSPVDAFTLDITTGYQDRELLSLPEESVENDVRQFAATPMSQVRPCAFDKFTESELKGGIAKRIKSEALRTARPKRLRRSLSDTDDPFAIIADENAADRPNGGSASETRFRTTCVVSSGTNVASSEYNYEWPVESYETSYADHEPEGWTRRPLLTASQPNGAAGWKGPCRVSRTCEAFVLHHGPRPRAIKPRTTAPVRVTLTRPAPVLPQTGRKRRPRTAGAPRQRRRALTQSLASTEPRSAGTRTSTPVSLTLSSRTHRVRSTNEPRGSKPGPAGTWPMGRPCKSAPQAIPATRLQRVDRASRTLDDAPVARATHSGPFFSFSSASSDGSNLPLSASTILRYSRPGTSVSSVAEK